MASSSKLDPDAPLVKGYHGLRGIPSNQDAINYLDQIQDEFRDSPETYEDFLSVMNKFRKDEISTTAVMQRVGEIFKGHPTLIEGFNVFLPPGVSMDRNGNQVGHVVLPPPVRIRMDRLDEIYTVIRFSEKIRTRNPEVYERFVAGLSNHYHRSHDVEPETVARQIGLLLQNDLDLYSQFQRLMGR